MEKKMYITPEIEITEFEAEDIITSSGFDKDQLIIVPDPNVPDTNN